VRACHPHRVCGPMLGWARELGSSVAGMDKARRCFVWPSQFRDVSNQSLVTRRKRAWSLINRERTRNRPGDGSMDGEAEMDGRGVDFTRLDWTGLEWPFPKGCLSHTHMSTDYRPIPSSPHHTGFGASCRASCRVPFLKDFLACC
jgi:hypothetical protein